MGIVRGLDLLEVVCVWCHSNDNDSIKTLSDCQNTASFLSRLNGVSVTFYQ